MTHPLSYAEHVPPPELAHVVVSLWTFGTQLAEGESLLHHVWPDGCTSLVVIVQDRVLRDVLFAGPVLEAHRMPAQRGLFVCGARFWPDAAGAALGVPAGSLRGGATPAVALLGADAEARGREIAAAPREAAPVLLGSWLRAALPAHVALDACVRRAVQLLVESHGELPVAQLAGVVGLSPRQLQRRFRAATGLTPKEYARIRRMRSALAALMRGELPLAAVAGALGYADQPHLARELRDLTGLTPVELRHRLGVIEHVDVTP